MRFSSKAVLSEKRCLYEKRHVFVFVTICLENESLLLVQRIAEEVFLVLIRPLREAKYVISFNLSFLGGKLCLLIKVQLFEHNCHRTLIEVMAVNDHL